MKKKVNHNETNPRALHLFIAAQLLVGIILLLVLFSQNSKPGDVLYGIDRTTENIEIAIAYRFGGDLRKAEVHLSLAEERIQEIAAITDSTSAFIKYVEAQPLSQTQKDIYVRELTVDYNKHLKEALSSASKAESIGINADKVYQEVAENVLKHQEVLLFVYEKVPVPAKESVVEVLEISKVDQERAVQRIDQPKREAVKEKVKEIKEEIDIKITEKREEVQQRKQSAPGRPEQPGVPEDVEPQNEDNPSEQNRLNGGGINSRPR